MGSTAAEAMARSFSDKVRLASRTDAEKEVENLPQDMRFSVSQSTARVKFYDAKHPDRQSPDHPVLGALPSAWELRAKMNALEPDKCDRLFYYNTCTRETSMEDPRGQSPDGPSRRSSRVVAFRDSALQRRLSTGQSKIRRRHIGSSPELEQLRSEQVYAVVKTLDPGSRQGKGGMNGGVHVVRCLKGPSGRLYVRKDIDAAGEFAERCMRREIRLMRDLKHCGLVAYIDAAVEDGDRRDRDDPWLLGPRNRDTYAKRSGLGLKATVIMEYCDLGTLDDLLHRLSLLRENGRNGAGDRCPEAFVWHAWMALVDALAFLQTGLSVKAGSLDSSQASRKGGWKPLIHGDIKPDNVFLRLSQSSPYPHVLLADWGLARSQECAEEEDRTTFQGMDFWFLSGSFLYHAPELAFDPNPSALALNFQLRPHTIVSDVWSITACILCLCERSIAGHIDTRYGSVSDFASCQGRQAKLSRFELRESKQHYSTYLQAMLILGGSPDPSDRPSPFQLAGILSREAGKWHHSLKKAGIAETCPVVPVCLLPITIL